MPHSYTYTVTYLRPSTKIGKLHISISMGLLPDTQNFGLRRRRECRERFFLSSGVSDPDMHPGTCVTHVPWCRPGSLTAISFEVGCGAHAQSPILRIWQEAQGNGMKKLDQIYFAKYEYHTTFNPFRVNHHKESPSLANIANPTSNLWLGYLRSAFRIYAAVGWLSVIPHIRHFN